MHLPPRVFLLRVVHCVMRIARDQPVAAGRVRVELAAGLYGEVGGLLHRLHSEISGRVDDDSPLAADPRDDGWSVLVIMPPPGLTLLAAPTRAASQRLLAPTLRLALLAGGVIEVIRFHCALQLPIGL